MSIRERLRANKQVIQFMSRIYFFRSIPYKDYLNPKKISLLWHCRWHSLSKYERLSNLYELAKQVKQLRIEGAFVECGVYEGGSAAVVINHLGDRQSWLFDSWQGLPETVEMDTLVYKGQSRVLKKGDFHGSLEITKDFLLKDRRYEESKIHFIKGWFNETLPVTKEKIGKIAFLHIDADIYESTKDCLENLYDQVVSGGYLVFDEYQQVEGERVAVEEFLARRNIKVEIKMVGKSAAYFVKP